MELRRVAAELGFSLAYSLFHTAALARETITWHIRHSHPILLCVDVASDGPWQHWICIVGASKRGVTIADSARPGPVVQRISWTRLMQRLAVWVDEKTNRYDIYPLIEK